MMHCSWKTGHLYPPWIRGLGYSLSKFTKLFYGKLVYYEREANLITWWQHNVFLVLVPGSVDMTEVVVWGNEREWLWTVMTRGQTALVLVSADRAPLFQTGTQVEYHQWLPSSQTLKTLLFNTHLKEINENKRETVIKYKLHTCKCYQTATGYSEWNFSSVSVR